LYYSVRLFQILRQQMNYKRGEAENFSFSCSATISVSTLLELELCEYVPNIALSLQLGLVRIAYN
jgi:hypothetical protein